MKRLIILVLLVASVLGIVKAAEITQPPIPVHIKVQGSRVSNEDMYRMKIAIINYFQSLGGQVTEARGQMTAILSFLPVKYIRGSRGIRSSFDVKFGRRSKRIYVNTGGSADQVQYAVSLQIVDQSGNHYYPPKGEKALLETSYQGGGSNSRYIDAFNIAIGSSGYCSIGLQRIENIGQKTATEIFKVCGQRKIKVEYSERSAQVGQPANVQTSSYQQFSQKLVFVKGNYVVAQGEKREGKIIIRKGTIQGGHDTIFVISDSQMTKRDYHVQSRFGSREKGLRRDQRRIAVEGKQVVAEFKILSLSASSGDWVDARCRVIRSIPGASGDRTYIIKY